MGTGCNAAYFENFGSIPKIHREGITADTLMAINCEWGAFDNEHKILPRTDYDVLIDRESPRPGQQSYEKMVSGLYLGEIFRLAILDLGRRGSLFLNQDLDVLEHSFCFATEAMAQIERYADHHLLNYTVNHLTQHYTVTCQTIGSLSEVFSSISLVWIATRSIPSSSSIYPGLSAQGRLVCLPVE